MAGQRTSRSRGSNYRRYAAGAAGATLGFIGGNLPGAVAGYKAGTTMADWTSGLRRTKPGLKRKKSKSPPRVSKKRRTTRRRVWKSRRSSNQNKPLKSHIVTSGYRQRYYSKIPRGFRKLLAPRIQTWTCTYHANISGGKQWVDYPTCYTNGTTNSAFLLDRDQLVDVQSNLRTDDVASTLGVNTLRYWIDYVKVQFRMKNQTNLPLTVDFYDMTPRRDIAIYATGESATSAKTPAQDWRDGMQDMTNQTVPTGYSTWDEVPGLRPTQSPRFCQNWKILRTSRFQMQRGEEHIHTVFLSPKYPFNNELTTRSEAYKSLSYIPMIVVQGPMVHDTVSKLPSLGDGGLDIIAYGKIKFGAIGKNRTIWNSWGGLSTTILEANEMAMDEQSTTAIQEARLG